MIGSLASHKNLLRSLNKELSIPHTRVVKMASQRLSETHIMRFGKNSVKEGFKKRMDWVPKRFKRGAENLKFIRQLAVQVRYLRANHSTHF